MLWTDKPAFLLMPWNCLLTPEIRCLRVFQPEVSLPFLGNQAAAWSRKGTGACTPHWVSADRHHGGPLAPPAPGPAVQGQEGRFHSTHGETEAEHSPGSAPACMWSEASLPTAEVAFNTCQEMVGAVTNAESGWGNVS